MSDEINIKIQDELKVKNGGIFLRNVKPFGNNGAMINFQKQHIGKQVIVIIVDKIQKEGKSINEIIEDLY